ncbi:MAG TPA: maleylpyruvate isomerase N-terminal domain-containing protein [Ktedonobacterales bacterium]|nr:maleylpyruvate isomerase N-terminal domain-containing protein [Ktedonobacterales bacterium]
MNKALFLETLRSKRAEWETLLAEVGEARMMQPGPAGEWSLKDIIAHVTWGEREMVGVLQARALVGSDLWGVSQFERNAAVYAQNRDRPLPEVLAEAREVHAQLVAALEKVSDDDLNDARRFAQMPAAWMPWQVIAGNSYGHYDEHMPAIRAWLDQAST